MNSKKAKEFRRLAREHAAAAPQRVVVAIRNGQVINSPYSERGLYRRMKAEERKGQ